MTSKEKKIIKELNSRVLTQSIVIQTLVDLLVESNVISENELDEKLVKNTELLNQTLSELGDSSQLEEPTYEINYYGPVGEA